MKQQSLTLIILGSLVIGSIVAFDMWFIFQKKGNTVLAKEQIENVLPQSSTILFSSKE